MNMQDPRDIVLLHQFDFNMELNGQNGKMGISDADYERILLQVQ